MANFVKIKLPTRTLTAQMQLLTLLAAANVNKFDFNHDDHDFAYEQMDEKGWLTNKGISLKGREEGLGLQFLNLLDQMNTVSNTLNLLTRLVREGKLTGENVDNLQYMCQIFADTRAEITVTEELIEPAVIAEVEVEVAKVETKAKKSKKVTA